MENHPPSPRLALSIGVVGHRPNRLAEADYDEINTEVERVIGLITHEVGVVYRRYQIFFSDSAPQICLVSALAEGADRIVAKAALSKGFVLDVPVPFLKEEYERDFYGDTTNPPASDETNNSVKEFNALTADDMVRSLLQLPGRRSDTRSLDTRDTDNAYEMAGLTVIGQADILLTVWDRGPSAGTRWHSGHAAPSGEARRSHYRNQYCRAARYPDSMEPLARISDRGGADYGSGERFEQASPKSEELVRPPSSPSEPTVLLSYPGDHSSAKGWWRRAAGLCRIALTTAKCSPQALQLR